MKDSTGMGSVWTLPPTSGPIGGWQRERGPPLVVLCAGTAASWACFCPTHHVPLLPWMQSSRIYRVLVKGG